MELTYFYGNRAWCRVHAGGCKDAKIEWRKDNTGTNLIPTEASSQREVIEEVAGDFIFYNDQQPWTDYIGQVEFAPCCANLPLEVQS